MDEEFFFEIETLKNQIEYLFFKLEEVMRKIESIEERLSRMGRE